MTSVSPLLVLQARAEARAKLYAALEFDLADALAPLFDYATRAGIADEVGADTTFAIVKTAFAGVVEL